MLVFQTAELDDSTAAVSDVELLDMSSSRMHLDFVTGTMMRERVEGFMRLLWCACRGNAFFKFVDLPEEMEDINTVSSMYDSTPVF